MLVLVSPRIPVVLKSAGGVFISSKGSHLHGWIYLKDTIFSGYKFKQFGGLLYLTGINFSDFLMISYVFLIDTGKLN